MKIAIFNTLYPPQSLGGAERSVRSLAEGLAEKGHEVVVFSTCPGVAAVEETLGPVLVKRVPLKNIYWPFGNVRQPAWKKIVWHLSDCNNIAMKNAVGKLFEPDDFDIAHFNNLAGFSPAVIRNIEKSDIPIVHTLRDYYALCINSMMYRQAACHSRCFGCSINSTLKGLKRRRIDAVVGISRHILSVHSDAGGIPSEAAKHVIYNGINSELAESRKAPRENVRFGFLGRLHASKGIQVLLAAAAGIREDQFELLVAGTGDDAFVESLHGLAKNNSSISFLGRVESQSFLRRIDVLVVPSIWGEPFGRVVIEANRQGVPVIAFPTGAMPELVFDNSGVLLKSTSQDALEHAIRDLLDAPDRISEYSRSALKTGERFGVGRMIDSYEKLFLELHRRKCHG